MRPAKSILIACMDEDQRIANPFGARFGQESGIAYNGRRTLAFLQFANSLAHSPENGGMHNGIEPLYVASGGECNPRQFQAVNGAVSGKRGFSPLLSYEGFRFWTL